MNSLDGDVDPFGSAGRSTATEPIDSRPAGIDPTGPRPRWNWRRLLGPTLGAFLFYFVLMAIWSIGTPIWGSPDEPQHAYRAYSAAHGELYVKPVAAAAGTGGFVKVPKSLSESGESVGCYAFQPAVSAACAQDPGPDSTIVSQSSTAARYDPVYYFVVGLPSLVISPRHVLYAFRLVSAALSAWMLAWALTSAAFARRPRIAMAGVLLAVTPMAVYLGAVVNPNGLEISAACALWVNAILLFRGDREDMRALLLRRAAISGSVLVLMRSLSPLWLLVIFAVALIAARPGLRQRLWQKDVGRWAAVVVAASLAAGAWILVSRSLQLGQLPKPLDYSLRTRLHLARVRQTLNFDEEIGYFGWLDTSLRQWAYNAWGYTALFLGLISVALARWRDRVAMIVIAAVAYGLPILIEAFSWNQTGPVWQGRYSMPLTVGIVIAAGLGLADAKWVPKSVEWVVAVVAALLAGCALGYTLAITIWRNAVGLSAPFSLNGPWQPPGGGLFVEVAECLVVLLGLIGVLGLSGRLAPRSPETARQPESSAHPELARHVAGPV